MNMNTYSSPSFTRGRGVAKKLLLSAFVVFSFVAYAIHKPQTSASSQPSQASGSSNNLVIEPLATNAPAANASNSNTAQTGSATNTNTTTTQGAYKDGTYTGPQADAYYGYVQVQATIQNGKLTNVQFLQYPNDRRNSAAISSYAIPYLQQEAIQAQSANVDIVTGATLTSRAFMQSLQAALNQAK